VANMLAARRSPPRPEPAGGIHRHHRYTSFRVRHPLGRPTSASSARSPRRGYHAQPPRPLDEDFYQVLRVQADPASYDLLKEWVVWTAPTDHLVPAGYVSRLIEAAAWADVIV